MVANKQAECIRHLRISFNNNISTYIPLYYKTVQYKKKINMATNLVMPKQYLCKSI